MKTALYDTRHVIKLNPYHGLDEGGQLFSSGGEIDSRTVAAWPLRYSVAPLASVLEFAVRNLGEADTEEGREKALDTIFGRIVNVDLDVDSNYDGEIDDDDEPLEMDPGGLACVGTNNLTRIELKLEPAGLPGKVTLSVEKGGNLIRVWENPNRTDQVTLPKIWNDGAQPGALYIEGVSPSSKAHDVELKLEYDETPQGDNSGLFKCEDRVKLTVVKVGLSIWNGGSDLDNGQTAGPQGDRVPDADKQTVGAYLLVNWDDDDGDGTMNADGTWATLPVPDLTKDYVANEDNLAKLQPTLEPLLYTGTT